MTESIDLSELREILTLAREFGVRTLKLDTLELEFTDSLVPPSITSVSPTDDESSPIPDELPIEMPSADELLFGHTGMLPEAMTND